MSNPPTITISTPQPSPWFTPIFMAVDGGFLAEEGLEGKIVFRVGLDGLASGEADFVASSPGRMNDVDLRGIRMICGRADGTSHMLMVRPEIQRVEAIEHLIMLTDEALDNELRIVLAEHGIELDELGARMTRVPGSHPEQYDLLQQGMGDGAPIGGPYWMYLSKLGYRNLGGAAELAPGMSIGGIFASADRVARQPALVQGFVRAYLRAIAFCRQNREAATQSMLTHCRPWGIDGPEIAEEVYDWAVRLWKPDVDVDVVAEQLDRLARRSGRPQVPVGELVDLSFLKNARP